MQVLFFKDVEGVIHEVKEYCQVSRENLVNDLSQAETNLVAARRRLEEYDAMSAGEPTVFNTVAESAEPLAPVAVEVAAPVAAPIEAVTEATPEVVTTEATPLVAPEMEQLPPISIQ